MGWDYTHATHYTRTGAIDKKAEIDELYTWQNDTKKYEVVRSCMVGATYYAAVKATVLNTGEVRRRCIDAHKQPGLFQLWS